MEEAAEILEAHVLTALSKDCKHLILIGNYLVLLLLKLTCKQCHIVINIFDAK